MITLHLMDALDGLDHPPVLLPYDGKPPEIVIYRANSYARIGVNDSHAYYRKATVVVIG